MFSRTIFCGYIRKIPQELRTISILSRLKSSAFHASPSVLRHTSKEQIPLRRIKHTYYDPHEAKRAKPLLTTQQIYDTATQPASLWLYAISIGSAIIFYFSHIETVPISGRKRFMYFSDAAVEKDAQQMYQTIMHELGYAILPPWHPKTRQVNRVMQRLIQASELQHVSWEVHVVNSPQANAFVMPGGKVFVMSGILPIVKNDDGLAAILGHEIAHNLARHQAERMSNSFIIMGPMRLVFFALDALLGGGFAAQLLGNLLLDLGVGRPASRKQESEADYIGLMMMARSCYDPKAALGVWERMELVQREEAIPQWLSTHPSNATRIEALNQWLPKAEDARAQSGCKNMYRYTDDFRSAWLRENAI